MNTGAPLIDVRRNSLFGILGFLIPSAAVFVSWPLLLRGVGVEGFGIYSLAISLTSAVSFFDLGMTAATLKHVGHDVASGDRASAASVISTSLVFYAALGCAAALLVCALAPTLAAAFGIAPSALPSATAAFRIAGFQTVPALVTSVSVSVLKALGRFDLSTAALCACSLISNLGGAFAVTVLGAGIVGLSLASLAANLAAAVFSLSAVAVLCSAKDIPLRAARPGFARFRRLFSFGSAVAVHASCALLFSHALRWLLGAVAGPAAVGAWSLAAGLAVRAHSLVVAATEVLFPLASSRPALAGLRRVYLRMLAAGAAAAAAVLLPLGLFAGSLLEWWVGHSAASRTAPVLSVLALGYFAVALSPAPFYIFNGLGRPWTNVAIDALNAALAASCLLAFRHAGPLTVLDFAWAFTISNLLTAVAYQLTAELTIWRPSPDLQSPLSSVPPTSNLRPPISSVSPISNLRSPTSSVSPISGVPPTSDLRSPIS